MASSLSLSLVRLDVAEGVATITIHRPESNNSLNPAVVHQMQQAVDAVIADPGVRGIVVGGAGKTFVVGADVEFFVRNIEAGDIERIVQFTKAGQRLLNTLDRSPKPVVARVHGPALGGGFELTLACDSIVAAPGASFALPETGLGIYPGLGGTQRLSRAIGLGLAKWLIFTGKTLPAAEALKIGLVDQISTAEQLDEICRGIASGNVLRPARPALPAELVDIERFFQSTSAQTLLSRRADTRNNPALLRAAASVASKPPLAVRLAERLIDEGAKMSLDESLQMEIDHLAEVFSTEEARRRLSSLVKKHV